MILNKLSNAKLLELFAKESIELVNLRKIYGEGWSDTTAKIRDVKEIHEELMDRLTLLNTDSEGEFGHLNLAQLIEEYDKQMNSVNAYDMGFSKSESRFNDAKEKSDKLRKEIFRRCTQKNKTGKEFQKKLRDTLEFFQGFMEEFEHPR